MVWVLVLVLGWGPGRGTSRVRKARESVTKIKTAPNQNLSARNKKELQHQQLLQEEIKLYRETHGREPNYQALLLIAEKFHLDYEYAERLLSGAV